MTNRQTFLSLVLATSVGLLVYGGYEASPEFRRGLETIIIQVLAGLML